MLTSTICASCKPHFRAWESHTGSQIPVSKKLYMVSVWILVIRRVGNEKFVQNLIIEVKVQEMSLKMKAKKDSSGKLREQSALLIWASGSIWLVLYLASLSFLQMFSVAKRATARQLNSKHWLISWDHPPCFIIKMDSDQVCLFLRSTLKFVTWCSSQFFFL